MHAFTSPDAAARGVAARVEARSVESGELPGFFLWAVTRGSADLAWRTRRIRLDPDAYLILDARAQADCVCLPASSADLRVIAFRVVDVALPVGLPAFGAHLRSTAGKVGQRLRALAGPCPAASRPPAVEVEERRALLAEILDEDRALRQRADAIGSVKQATREELLRRILLAADFIQTHHDEPLSLADMAGAASLSRYHFLRLFTIVHEETPHAYLLRKRTAVARRHLELGGGCDEAAARAGFGSRSALFRSLRKRAREAAASPLPCHPEASPPPCCRSA